MAKGTDEYPHVQDLLVATPRRWLVTGAAGFIGSNLVEALLRLGQTVVGFDNFETGHRHNLSDVKERVGEGPWGQFTLIEGDIRCLDSCRSAFSGGEIVLHQAALGSVPRSVEDPLRYHESNVTGFLNMLTAARDAGVKRFVYASSSSVYGDSPELPKVEERTGKALSPYAATKAMNEVYASVFGTCYGMETIGLRYFNVFGPRQDPNGAYAAVIPRWLDTMMKGEACLINGDPAISRDFCFVENVIRANILAGMTPRAEALNRVYNIAYGTRTTLRELFEALRTGVEKITERPVPDVVIGELRKGDIPHSHADISAARTFLGYSPLYSLSEGLKECIPWYLNSRVS